MNTHRNNETKSILDGLIELFSRNRQWLLFFGTGTSCALDTGFGMPELTNSLNIQMGGETEWTQIQSLLEAGISLEGALTGVGLSTEMKSRIQKATGDYIAKIDREVRDEVLLGKRPWVGETLVKALVRRLPPLNPRLPIVTANYDMLIEYACARHGIRYTTGFYGETIRKWDWEQAKDSLNQCRLIREGMKSFVLIDPLPHVELFKVHGSINLFTKGNQQIECDLWSEAVPDGLARVIAAPGDQKYEQYTNIMDTAARANRAQDEAMAFAMIGYGFKDRHLHERIYGRVRSQDCPLLVLTRDLADESITELRALSKGVWILLASKRSNGDIDESQTCVYSPSLETPIILNNDRLWRSDCFAERIIGG